jgi:hypothetical protein
MPRVSFTSNLRRHLECEAGQVEGATLGDFWSAVSQHLPPVYAVRFG